MLIAQSRVTHVRKFDVALRAAVHEQIAVYGVKLSGGDDLGQLLHVHWLDIHDVFPTDKHPDEDMRMSKRGLLTEATVADIQVPEVNSQVIRRDIRFLVRVDGYRMDVISMSIRVHFAWDGRDNVVLLLHAGESEML